jgi:hypothetical protein
LCRCLIYQTHIFAERILPSIAEKEMLVSIENFLA